MSDVENMLAEHYVSSKKSRQTLRRLRLALGILAIFVGLSVVFMGSWLALSLDSDSVSVQAMAVALPEVPTLEIPNIDSTSLIFITLVGVTMAVVFIEAYRLEKRHR